MAEGIRSSVAKLLEETPGKVGISLETLQAGVGWLVAGGCWKPWSEGPWQARRGAGHGVEAPGDRRLGGAGGNDGGGSRGWYWVFVTSMYVFILPGLFTATLLLPNIILIMFFIKVGRSFLPRKMMNDLTTELPFISRKL